MANEIPAGAREFIDAMRAQPCDYCGALPGERCVTSTGRQMGSVDYHSPRFYAAKQAQAQAVDDSEVAAALDEIEALANAAKERGQKQ